MIYQKKKAKKNITKEQKAQKQERNKKRESLIRKYKLRGIGREKKTKLKNNIRKLCKV